LRSLLLQIVNVKFNLPIKVILFFLFGHLHEVCPLSQRFSFQFQAEEPKGGKTLDDVERSHIERILRETQHNLSRAARILDIDRTTLYNKLRRYGLR